MCARACVCVRVYYSHLEACTSLGDDTPPQISSPLRSTGIHALPPGIHALAPPPLYVRRPCARATRAPLYAARPLGGCSGAVATVRAGGDAHTEAGAATARGCAPGSPHFPV